jgi:hypothetical protein
LSLRAMSVIEIPILLTVNALIWLGGTQIIRRLFRHRPT